MPRTRKLLIVLVVLVVLGALFVAADRALAFAAERVVARRVQAAADLRVQPSVKIRGFPFVTQAVGGAYRRIDVSVPRFERGGVRLEDVVVHLHHVHAPLERLLRAGHPASIRVESATAAAVVPYDVIEKRFPAEVDVTPHGDRMRLTGDVDVLGKQLSASALVRVRASGQDLVFDVTEVRVEGHTASAALRDQFSFAVEVGDLPFGARMTAASVTADGVRVRAAGNDLTVASPRGAAALASRGRDIRRSVPLLSETCLPSQSSSRSGVLSTSAASRRLCVACPDSELRLARVPDLPHAAPRPDDPPETEPQRAVAPVSIRRSRQLGDGGTDGAYRVAQPIAARDGVPPPTAVRRAPADVLQ